MAISVTNSNFPAIETPSAQEKKSAIAGLRGTCVCVKCGHMFQPAELRLRNADNWLCSVCNFEPIIRDGFLSFAPELATGDDWYVVEFYEEMYKLQERNFWYSARNTLISWAIKKYFPEMVDFLEIGCGTGFVVNGIAESFPSATVNACDIFFEALQFARGRVPAANFYQLDARRLPFRQVMDVVGIFDVLEHITEDSAVMEQSFEALRPGGGLIVTVPQHQFLWGPSDTWAKHVRRYSADELINKAEAAGFEIVRMSSFVTTLFPLLLLSKARFYFNPGKYDPRADLSISPLLNTMLGSISTVDQALISMGANMPFGGSLLLIARRPL